MSFLAIKLLFLVIKSASNQLLKKIVIDSKLSLEEMFPFSSKNDQRKLQSLNVQVARNKTTFLVKLQEEYFFYYSGGKNKSVWEKWNCKNIVLVSQIFLSIQNFIKNVLCCFIFSLSIYLLLFKMVLDISYGILLCFLLFIGRKWMMQFKIRWGFNLAAVFPFC